MMSSVLTERFFSLISIESFLFLMRNHINFNFDGTVLCSGCTRLTFFHNAHSVLRIAFIVE